MTMRIIILLVVGILLTGLQGCIFIHTYAPLVEGKVIDKESGEPITAAMIHYREYPKISTTTSAEGDFSIGPLKQLAAKSMFIIIQPIPPRGTLVVEKEGYKKHCVWVETILSDEKVEVEIRLEQKEEK